MPQPQTSILTVTLNPALDLSAGTATVHPGPKLRCDTPRYDPGGGGINISRAIGALGGDSAALVALGGATGAQLADLLLRDGVVAKPLPAPGDTRLSLSITAEDTRAQYRFVLPGPHWPAPAVEAAVAAIVAAAPAGGFVAISGSQPPGFPENAIARISAALPDETRLVADTSGAPLRALAAGQGARLFCVRMDAEEAESLANRPLPRREDSADFAQSLVQRGVAENVIIARGPDGSVMVTEAGRWFCPAPTVPVISKIGAGDSFVAGFVLALARGQSVQAALGLGVAAASAAVMTPATELCRRSDTEALAKVCVVEPI